MKDLCFPYIRGILKDITTACTQEKYFELNARYVCLKNAHMWVFKDWW